MAQQKVWKQTRSMITQVPITQVFNEVQEIADLPPESVEKHLVVEKRCLKIQGAKYHIWRDSLH